MSNKRLFRVCFTGHRPDKMDLTEAEAKPLLAAAIDKAIEQGFKTFISGMAMGVDIWAAELVLERKKKNKELHLIAALPHPNFESRRAADEIKRFNKIIAAADLVQQINDRYFRACYQVRNEWMVDRSALVIALFNGQKSGTKNTIDYAKRKGVKVMNVLNMEDIAFFEFMREQEENTVKQNEAAAEDRPPQNEMTD